MSFDSLTTTGFRTTGLKIACVRSTGLCAIEHFQQLAAASHLFSRAENNIYTDNYVRSRTEVAVQTRYSGTVRTPNACAPSLSTIVPVPSARDTSQKENRMKTTILAALLAMASLTACEKTTVNPPTTVITPAAPAATTSTVAVPVPVPVPGPAGAPGAPGSAGEKGDKGEAGKAGDTTIIVPEKSQ